MDIEELWGRKVGMLVSGGLSSVAVAAWLAAQGVETIAYVADIGQTGPAPDAALYEALGRLGLTVRAVDLRAEMAETALRLVAHEASYDGGYWNTTGASRAVLVSGLASALRADGCEILAHGCVGGGNDQARFARYGAALAPDLEVFAPWTAPWMRERFPDRGSMAAYLASVGFPEQLAGWATYSVEGNLAGFSHESDLLESLATPPTAVSPLMTVWPPQAADEPQTVRIRFERSRPVEIDGVPVSGLEAVLRANANGGRHGISLRSTVENRVNGTKCRGVYEAPGLDVLGQCLAALRQACLDKPGTLLMRELSGALATAVYEGRCFDAAGRAAAEAADILAAEVSGTVVAELYRGTVTVHTLTDLPGNRGTARQTRFTQGGHHWQLEAAS